MRLYVFTDCGAKFMRGCMGIQADSIEEATEMASAHSEHPTKTPSEDVDLIYEVGVSSEERGLVFNTVEMV